MDHKCSNDLAQCTATVRWHADRRSLVLFLCVPLATKISSLIGGMLLNIMLR